MSTYYIIDTKTNSIINAVETSSRERAEASLAHMVDPEHLRIDPDPPMAMLQRYRYWSERP